MSSSLFQPCLKCSTSELRFFSFVLSSALISPQLCWLSLSLRILTCVRVLLFCFSHFHFGDTKKSMPTVRPDVSSHYEKLSLLYPLYYVGLSQLGFLFCFVLFLGPHSQHMEFPRLGVESEL